jgi:hypothetical protein
MAAGHMAASAVCALLIAGPVTAQQPLPSPEGTPPAAQQQPDPSHRPGLLDTLNRWLGDSKAAIDSQLRQTQETLGSVGHEARGAAGAAQEAAGAVVALPMARIVNGRQTCQMAGNGAPDCQPAIDALCRSKGFISGKSLEISSAHKCPTRVWLYGSSAEKSACPVETYVTRALCQ